MRKLLTHALLITTILLLPTTNFAQGSPGSIPQSPVARDTEQLKQETKIVKADQQAIAQKVDRDKILARLLKEIEDGRSLIKTSKEREAALVAEVKAADEANAKLTEAYKLSLIEIGELRAKIVYEEKALAERQQQVELLRQEIAGLKGKIKSLRKRELLNTVKDIALAALWILRR